MSDYLTNLVTRSFTATPVIQPRVPSLFEPTAEETFNRVQTPAPAAEEAPSPASPAPLPPLASWPLSIEPASPAAAGSFPPLAPPTNLRPRPPGPSPAAAASAARSASEASSAVRSPASMPVIAEAPSPAAAAPGQLPAPPPRPVAPMSPGQPPSRPSPAVAALAATSPAAASIVIPLASAAAVPPPNRLQNDIEPTSGANGLTNIEDKSGGPAEVAGYHPSRPAADAHTIQPVAPPPGAAKPARKFPAPVVRAVPREPAPPDSLEPSGAPRHHIPAPPAPAIHVTIGRVEVRAVPPPAPKVAQPARPKLSLDEYLAQRAGGSR